MLFYCGSETAHPVYSQTLVSQRHQINVTITTELKEHVSLKREILFLVLLLLN